MYEPKTEYVKGKLRKTRWKDHDYIENLMKLEKFVASGEKIQNFSHAMAVRNLTSEHSKDYLAILKELNPEGYEKTLKKMREDNARLADVEKEMKEEMEEKRKAWLKAGGKP